MGSPVLGHSPEQLLAPLAARYAPWLGLPAQAAAEISTAEISDEDADSVRAMPLILRMERDALPPRSALLAAAASAAVALCLDERAEPGGSWHPEIAPWLAGRIRKVARRARGAHWQAVGELPGLTVEYQGAQVRALLPWRVAETPKVVTRLQVGGTDVPQDDPGAPPETGPVLWLAPQPMTAGKAAAQVGHATMLLAALLAAGGRGTDLDRWAADGYRCAVRTASRAGWTRLAPGEDPGRAWRERGLVAVRDAGFTEVAPGTVTVAAVFTPSGSP
ncbi:MAG TPA: peptidyl-tRNA hydrolase [Pseudonocardiaceae bacterium]|nr:peptidyl-tRNA hydrolase [Pseudonocardiaceae bacterium]